MAVGTALARGWLSGSNQPRVQGRSGSEAGSTTHYPELLELHFSINAERVEVRNMRECEIPREGVLPAPVYLTVEEPDLEFDRARAAARELARSYGSGAELLAWFDGKAGRYFPEAAECLEGTPPSWIQIAEAEGGNLAVDVNRGTYIFIFRGKQSLS
jgi:Domain of unknown function (DUF5619)